MCGFFKRDYKKPEPTPSLPVEKPVSPVPVGIRHLEPQPPIPQYPAVPQQIPQMQQIMQPQLSQGYPQPFQQQPQTFQQPQPQQQMSPDIYGINWGNDKMVVKNELVKVKNKVTIMETDLAYIKDTIKLLNRFLEPEIR
jgi:hypothetical protein